MSFPPPYSPPHSSDRFQPAPEPTKRPSNSGSILLEVIFDNYRSELKIDRHFERKFAFDWTNNSIFDGFKYFPTATFHPYNSTPPSLDEFVTRALEVLKNNESIKHSVPASVWVSIPDIFGHGPGFVYMFKLKNRGSISGNRWKPWEKLNVRDHFYSMDVWDERYNDYVYAFDGAASTLARPVKGGAKYRIRFAKASLPAS